VGYRAKTLMAPWGLVLGMAAAGCGGSLSGGTAAAPPSAEPTTEAASAGSSASAEAAASAGQVASALREIDGIAQQTVVAISDKAKSSELVGQIEPRWKPVEDTVKANSADAYTSFEDAFAALEDASASGDAAAATKGARAVSDTVASYTARYPG